MTFKYPMTRVGASLVGVFGAAFLAAFPAGRIEADDSVILYETQHLGRAGEGSTFGNAVAINANVIVVANAGGEGAGGVLSYLRQPDGTWVPVQGFTVENLSDNDYDGGFGGALDMDGDRALIGRPGEMNFRGAAYLFQMGSDGLWAQESRLPTPPPGWRGGDYGRAVALDGHTAVTSGIDFPEPYEGDTEGAAVSIFEESNGAWTVAHHDVFGGYHRLESLALDGDTLLVGHRDADVVFASDGMVFVLFRDSEGHWVREAVLVASDGQENARFGTSIALDGDRAIVGAPGLLYGYDGPGAAYVFERD